MSNSLTKQLARAAHPSWSKKRMMAMIAYFDEGGKPESKPVVSLAAVVGYGLKWYRFDVDWRNQLRLYKAPIHPTLNERWFHMTDFESPQCKDYQWKHEKRIKFISCLARMTKAAIVFGAVHSFLVSDWNEVVVPNIENPSERKKAWYLFPLQSVLEDIVRFVRVPNRETIACVFDENKEVSHAAKEHYADLKAVHQWDHIFGSATYDRSPLYPGLQAADMLAFEGRLFVQNETIDNRARPIRKLLESLQASGKITVARHDRISLAKFQSQWTALKQYYESRQS